MKLIIEIDEEDYHRIASGFGQEEDALLLEKIFKNGIPLEQYEYRKKMFSYLDGVADGLNESSRDTIDVLDKIRAEIDGIEINGQVDKHTMFIRSGEQVKQMALDIINKYKGDK